MDTMTAQARRFYHHVHNGGVLKEHDVAIMVEYMECKDAEITRLTAERDQALASVGAVIEKAANLMADWWNHPGGLDGTPAEIVLTLNPDATAALNEMLAKAYEAGKVVGALGIEEENPYRQPSRSSFAGKSEDRG